MPAPQGSSAGSGRIVARLLAPSLLTLPVLSFQYPLKLISSSISPSKCLTVFILSYGGGLVSDDKINLSVSVEEGAKLCLLTQGSTKIFKRKAPTHLTSQTLTVHLARNSTLLLLPDPLQPFAESVYKQQQTFHLPFDDSASIIVLDWYTEGRSALKEKWAFESFESRNDVYIRLSEESVENSNGDAGTSAALTNGVSPQEQPVPPPKLPPPAGRKEKLLLRDAVILTRASSTDDLSTRMDSMSVFGTLFIRGPCFARLMEGLERRFAEEPRIGGRNWHGEKKQKQRRFEGVVWTVAKARGFVIVKAGGNELEDVRAFLRSCLSEGEGGEEVVGAYGKGVLMCLQ